MPEYSNIIERGDANALIPQEQANEIIKNLPMASVALAKMRRTTMSRKQRRIPVLSALPTAYFVNGDTGLKQTTEQSWANKYLEAEELACIVPIPEAVLDDSEFDIWGEVRPSIEEAMGIALDAAVLFDVNKPASWGDAIVPGAAAAGNEYIRGSVPADDLAEDVNAVMTLVEEDGFDVNGFCARKAIKGAFRGLRDANGGLLFQPSLQAGTPGTLHGESIQYVNNGSWQNAEADMVAGDWSQAIIGVRQDITYKILTEAVIQDGNGDIVHNLAQQDMVALRCVFRVAYQVANPITRMNEVEADRFPFSVLRPAGYTP